MINVRRVTCSLYCGELYCSDLTWNIFNQTCSFCPKMCECLLHQNRTNPMGVIWDDEILWRSFMAHHWILFYLKVIATREVLCVCSFSHVIFTLMTLLGIDLAYPSVSGVKPGDLVSPQCAYVLYGKDNRWLRDTDVSKCPQIIPESTTKRKSLHWVNR